MASTRFGFIGSPRDASPWLLKSLATLGTLEAVCDENVGHEAARIPARWFFTRLSALLGEAEPDAVAVGKPLGLRPQVIKQCLTHGTAVLVAGAPGRGADCRRLVSLSRVAGRVLLAAPAIRYSPALVLARRLVEAGKLDTPVLMTVESSRANSDFRREGDSGPIPLDQVFEALDVVYTLIGPVQTVYAVAHAEATLVAAAVTEGGVPVSLVLDSNGRAEDTGLRAEVRAADGMRLLIDKNLQVTCGDGARVDATHRFAVATAEPAIELGYEGLVAEFCRLMRDPRADRGLTDQAWGALIAAEAVMASVTRGRPMEVRHPEKIATRRSGRARTETGLAFPE